MSRPPTSDSERAAAAKQLGELARTLRRPGETLPEALDRARQQRPDLARLGVPVHPDAD